jgi:hypothetical protein
VTREVVGVFVRFSCAAAANSTEDHMLALNKQGTQIVRFGMDEKYIMEHITSFETSHPALTLHQFHHRIVGSQKGDTRGQMK